jgi:predicted dehydrogenase/nucleoside-diphosphate-sugar epimerase
MKKKSDPFKAGLVGAGYISEYHVAALRRAWIPIVGLCDVDPARAQAASQKFGIPAMASVADLHAAGANVIHVLTPPQFHAKVALEALDLGCHVLVEKPLAEDVADCQAIARRANELGLRVCVNHSLLFDPQLRKAVQTVRSGKLGEIVSMDILRSSVYPPYGGGPLPPQYRAAGYPFRDLGVHSLYLFEAVLGPIENVTAQYKSLGGEPNLAFDEWRALVRCEKGLGQFQLSWNVKPLQSQMIIQGTRGVLRVDLFLMFQARRALTPLPKAAERIINAMTDSLKPMIDVPRGVWGFLRKKVLPYHGLQDLVAAFYQSLSNGTAPPVSAEEATRVCRWTEQVAREADLAHRRAVSTLKLADRVPVLVTGGGGNLGNAVVKKLLERGTRVRIMVRRPPANIPPGVEIALGDLADPEAVEKAVRGAQVVIHSGAAIRGPWLAHQGATVEGTRNVLDACKKFAVQKLVHVSSMSVLETASGDRTDTPVSESTPTEPRAEARGHYTRAKLLAEQLVTQYTKQFDLPTVILRPGLIVGGKLSLVGGAVARRLGKRWLILGNGDVRLPLIHLDDVVDAILLAADGPLRDGQIIQLVDDWTPTQLELLRVVHPGAKVIRFRRPILFSLGWLSQVMLGLLKRPSPLSPYRLRSALARRVYRCENAELLGWKPRHMAQARAGLPTAVEKPVIAPLQATAA